MKSIAIVGSRDYPNLEQVYAYVRALPPGTTIVSGGARGVDRTAERAALDAGLKTIILYPQWKFPNGKFNKAAGFERNLRIVEAADEVIAFWHGNSRGTAHTISTARAAGKPVTIISPEVQS